MAKLYLTDQPYRQDWVGGTYNQGAAISSIQGQLRYKNGEYFLSGTQGVYSTDSKNWKDLGYHPTLGNSGVNGCIIFQNNYYLAGGAAGGGASSIWRLQADQKDDVWTNVKTSSANASWYNFAEDGTTLVAVGNTGILAYTTDGITWAESASAKTIFGTQPIFSIAYSSTLNLWVAVGGGGLLATATTPSGTWTSRTSNFSGTTITQVHWCSSLALFIAVGSGGRITTSSDGTTWTLRTSNTTVALYAIGSNGSQLIAAGANATLVTSTNGTTWSAASRPLQTENWTTTGGNDIWWIEGTSTPGEFFACGPIRFVYRTTNNGSTWEICGSCIQTSPAWVKHYMGNGAIPATNLNILRELSLTPGSGQVSITNTFCTYTASTQYNFWGAWATPPWAQDQTLQSGTWLLSGTHLESNSAANWTGITLLNVYSWRPSTGAFVQSLNSGGSSLPMQVLTAIEPGTSSTLFQHQFSFSGGTITAGDIMVMELWSTHISGMATAYSGTINYNGTTESSLTNVASFIETVDTSLNIRSTIPTTTAMIT